MSRKISVAQITLSQPQSLLGTIYQSINLLDLFHARNRMKRNYIPATTIVVVFLKIYSSSFSNFSFLKLINPSSSLNLNLEYKILARNAGSKTGSNLNGHQWSIQEMDTQRRITDEERFRKILLGIIYSGGLPRLILQKVFTRYE